jgi:hypothetical protein
LWPGGKGIGRGCAQHAGDGYGHGCSCTTQEGHVTPSFPVLRHGSSRQKVAITAGTTRPGFP